MTWDVIVVGLGGAGASLLDALAPTGLRVLGLEQCATINHQHGASHSHTRGYRRAYEHPLYRRLTHDARPLWQALDEVYPTTLFHQEGGLMIGHPTHPAMIRLHESLEKDNDPFVIRPSTPSLHTMPDDIHIWEPLVGWLDGFACLSAWMNRAQAHGAHVRTGVAVHKVGANCVTLRSGETLHAQTIVFCVGAQAIKGVPWHILTRLEMMIDLPDERQLPMFHIVQSDGPDIYAMPSTPGKIMAGLYSKTLPPMPQCEQILLNKLQQYLDAPLTVHHTRHLNACMVDDGHFLVGQTSTPSHWFFGGLCGHGFKMLPILAQGLAQSILNGDGVPWPLFSPRRFDLSQIQIVLEDELSNRALNGPP